MDRLAVDAELDHDAAAGIGECLTTAEIFGGQTTTQVPQRMHFTWSIRCTCFRSPVMASVAHSFTQIPQPTHSSVMSK
jgi:hypothetical protein